MDLKSPPRDTFQCILGVSEVLPFEIFCVKLQHGSVVVVNVFMKYGVVSEVSLELSVKFDLNHDLTFRRVCSSIYCKVALLAK